MKYLLSLTLGFLIMLGAGTLAQVATPVTKQTTTTSVPTTVVLTAADLTYIFGQLAHLPNTPLTVTIPSPYNGANFNFNCNAQGGVNTGGSLTYTFN